MSSVLFSDLGLSEPLLLAVKSLGYEQPSRIQAAAIPLVLQGIDIIGQAQTGTGKTGAFALPLLERVQNQKPGLPKVLVLTPTRELALQVAEAFTSYAVKCAGVGVVSLCGGMDYRTQIRALKQGVQVVVGTPGRVIDHLDRGTLKLSELSALVLDEADEMLRMGFIDDVEKVLSMLPDTTQRALFSATMPKQIRRLAQTYLRHPEEVTIENKTVTVSSVQQRYLFVRRHDKDEALLRIMDIEDFDGVIIFARTKDSTLVLASFLQRSGYRAAALNGDLDQKAREKVVEQFKKGRIDVLVGTDVVARGLDVPRISHVINYDVPFDAQTYVHRIGRTGRAGREGDAILFVTPRDKRLLQNIERMTRQKVAEMPWPTADQVNALRKERFINQTLDKTAGKLQPYLDILTEMQANDNVDMLKVAAALAALAQGETPFYVDDKPRASAKADRKPSRSGEKRSKPNSRGGPPDAGMTRFRIEVGKSHGVRPGNIVGAIANEIGISSSDIGRIELKANFSTVDLPESLPQKSLNHLKSVWVSGRQLAIEPDAGGGAKPHKSKKPNKKHQKR